MKNATAAAYVPGIDGLRAVAVLSVILYHLDHRLLPAGFSGVDVFFVISGYVISKSLAASPATSVGDFILRFYQRRVLRIVPALLLCLVVTSVLSSLFLPDLWLSAHNDGTAIWALFGASNFFLVATADGYFSERVGFNPFVHTWSLGVEEQFYLLFPLLFYAWLRLTDRSPAVHRLAAWTLPVLALASLLLAGYETPVAHERAFYLLPSRFWELAAGALLFQLQARPSRIAAGLRAVSPRLLTAGGGALLAAGFLLPDQAAFPFPWALVPVSGALLVIAGMTVAERGRPGWLEARPMVFIGRISYSLYLWHWPVFALARWTTGLEGPLSIVLALMLTFGLSALSYHWVEQPFRRSRALRGLDSRRLLAGGLAAIAIAYLSVSQLFRIDTPYRLKQSVTAYGCDWHHDCPEAAGPVRRIARLDRRILVVGDSHAASYDTMLTRAAASLGADVTIASRPGCPVASLMQALPATASCRDYEDMLLTWAGSNLRPGDLVFLASLRVPRLSEQWGAITAAERQGALDAYLDENVRQRALDEARRLIDRLKAMGLHVLLDAPKPVFLAPSSRCSDWFNRMNPVCEPGFEMDREMLLSYRTPTMLALRELQDTHGVFVWDPFPALCSGAVCSAFDGAKPLFIDGDHLSAHGKRQLVPSFTNALLRIWHDDIAARDQSGSGEGS